MSRRSSMSTILHQRFVSIQSVYLIFCWENFEKLPNFPNNKAFTQIVSVGLDESKVVDLFVFSLQ